MKNVVLILFVTSLFCFCKPKPDFSIIAKVDYNVTPNVKKIKLGDTLRFVSRTSDIFQTLSGGSEKIPNATLSNMVTLYKVEKTTVNNIIENISFAQANDIKWKSNVGKLTTTNDGKLYQSEASYTNNMYVVDFFLIPQVKDTFFVDVRRGYLSNNTKSIISDVGFEPVNQNLELLPISYLGDGISEASKLQRRRTYAFIVE